MMDHVVLSVDDNDTMMEAPPPPPPPVRRTRRQRQRQRQRAATPPPPSRSRSSAAKAVTSSPSEEDLPALQQIIRNLFNRLAEEVDERHPHRRVTIQTSAADDDGVNERAQRSRRQ